MMHSFQQIVTQAERRYNFVVHGLPPLGDEMAVSPQGDRILIPCNDVDRRLESDLITGS